jgi:hypothetical protein
MNTKQNNVTSQSQDKSGVDGTHEESALHAGGHRQKDEPIPSPLHLPSPAHVVFLQAQQLCMPEPTNPRNEGTT